MKDTFRIHVLNAGTDHYCDEYSEDGVHIWGPVVVRGSKVVLVELERAVSSVALGLFIAQSLSRCDIARVQLFDDEIPFSVESLQDVLRKQPSLDIEFIRAPATGAARLTDP